MNIICYIKQNGTHTHHVRNSSESIYRNNGYFQSAHQRKKKKSSLIQEFYDNISQNNEIK